MNKESDSKKYRILLVAHNMQYGGAEKVFLNILKHLDRDLFIPYVACPQGPMLEKIYPLCEKVLITREGWLPSYFDPRGYITAAYTCFLNIIALIKFIKKNNINLVFSNTSVIFHGMIATWIVRIPSVVMIHETISPIFVRKLVFKMIYSINDKVVLISNAMLGTFRPSGDCSKIVRINEAIDISVFDTFPRNVPFDQYGINGRTYVIGLVGPLHVLKGHSYFIRMAAEVIKKVQNVKFIIIGRYTQAELQYYHDLLKLCETLGVSDYVTITGFVPDLLALMNRLDILAICSFTEGMSLVALEAMALGKPVVTFDVGGMAEAVTDHITGRVIPFGEYREMAKAVIAILQNEKMTKSMGEAGRKKVEQDFNVENQRKQLREVWINILNSK
ncbi:MAG: glycosyltransferase family 4 protein [Thermodesulfobacteriota bacterium]|nr:glycosyltransferase family 4 protein [Thermodesulfobacteriota bacterium]